MELFTNQVLAGISTGAIYACLALALVMIYQAIDHLNFAQGEMAMFSTFISWQLMQWGVPYWWVDGGMAALNLLLGAQALDLGALFFGLFGHERAVLERFGVPEGWRAVGTVALGVPDDQADRPGRSADRARRDVTEVIHRGSW